MDSCDTHGSSASMRTSGHPRYVEGHELIQSPGASNRAVRHQREFEATDRSLKGSERYRGICPPRRRQVFWFPSWSTTSATLGQRPRGPLTSLVGSMMMLRKSPITPSTAIPTIRRGIRRIQTSGYTNSPSRASGQQSTSKMHQTKNIPTRRNTSAL